MEERIYKFIDNHSWATNIIISILGATIGTMLFILVDKAGSWLLMKL